jgi:uncharacterized membrane protein
MPTSPASASEPEVTVLPVTTRALLCAGAGVVAAIVLAIVGPWWLIPIGAWDVAALAFLSSIWRSLWRLDARGTASHAKRENPQRSTADLLLLGASLISLLAVGLVLARASDQHGLDKGLLVGVCLLSIVLGWSIVHTVFTLRYARLYYGAEPHHGVNFNEDDLADYADFAYLALTIGMTFQVSDTNLRTKQIRRTALRHALLSYVFGALIVASTVNLIAGLGK